MAEKDNLIGLAMGLDVADLKTGINEVKKLVKQSKDEFNVATAGMDKWTKSSDGLTAKLKQLDKQLDAQQRAVEGYKAEIKRVSEMEGDHSIQLEQLKSKLNNAEIAVKKTESQINKYSTALSEVNAENKRAESSLGKLTSEIEAQKAELGELEREYKDAVLTYGKNSKEAKSLAKQIKSLSGELDDNQSKVQKADKQLELLEKQFSDTGNEAREFGSAMDNIKGLGSLAAKGAAAVGVAVGGLATAFFATAESTRELRTNMGKVETAFSTAGLSAEQATKTYQDLYAVVADEGKATEATSHIAKLAKSQEDLNKWVNISTGVYATFGDSLPIENLAEASNETAKTGKIVGGLADALNWAGVNEEKFQEALDACSNEQERNALITDTLNGLYSEASKTYQETNKDVIESNRAQAELADTMADVGAKAEPLMTALKNGFNDVMKAILDLVNNADFEGIKAGIENAFKYFIETIIPAIVDGFQWIMDNKDILIAGIVGIGTAMLAWNVVSIIQGVVGAIKGWMLATEGMTLAQRALNLVMQANPIGIVIALITALVAAFVYLWNTSDEFREFWLNLWEKIKEATSKAITAIGNWFSNLWENIKKIWGSTIEWFKNIGSKIANGFQKALNSTLKFFSNCWNNIKKAWSAVTSWFSNIGSKIASGFKNATNNVKNFFSNAWSNVKKVWSAVSGWFSNAASNVVNAFTNIPNRIRTLFSNAWNNVKSAWSNVKKFFDETKEKVLDAFSNLPDKMLNVGKDLIEGLWNGVKNMGDWISRKLEGFSSDVLGSIKSFFGIKSPSRKMAEVGGYMAEGMAKGLEDGKSDIAKAGAEAGEAYAGAVGSLAGKTAEEIIEHFNNLPDKKEVKVEVEAENEEIVIEPEIEFDEFDKNLDGILDSAERRMKEWCSGIGGMMSRLGEKMSSALSTGFDVVGHITDFFSASISAEMEALDYELEKFNKVKDEEAEKAEETYNARLEELKAMNESGMMSDNEYQANKKLLETDYNAFMDQVEEEKKIKEQELLERKNKLAEKQFNSQQAVNIAQTISQGALAIVRGYAELGPIAGAINAIKQAAITAFQIATIKKQKYVPMLAKGGIVDGATLAVIGERGKEAVMPLENNTGWITELAEKISAIMGRDYIGGVMGYNYAVPAVAGDTIINNYYTQNINAPKSPSRKEIYRDTKNLLSLKGV